jgi:spermidine/putrescine transport system permease protein
MKRDKFQLFSIGINWLWLVVFALLPFALIFVISFTKPGEKTLIVYSFNINNYLSFVNSTYIHIFVRSFVLAGITTLLCLAIGYPFAYLLAQSQSKAKNFLIYLMIIPFWTSSLIRSFAMIAVLKTKGLLNSLLLSVGIIDLPMQLLYTNIAVIIGLIYNLLPFMILPLFANIERLDTNLVDAAKDLGANWFTIFRRIILPLTIPGILGGCMMVFLPSMTLFYVPDLLGGSKSMLLGNLIQDQFLFANNWPQGAAISVVLTIIMALLLWVYWRNSKAKDRQALL